LFLTSSHDGSGCITACFTPIRVRCRNVLTLAISRAERIVRIKHTKRVRIALAGAEKILACGGNYFERARDFYRSLSTTTVSGVEVTTFIERVFPATNTDDGLVVTPSPEKARSTVARLIAGEGLVGFDPGSPTTRWKLLNAITQYVDTARPVRR